MTPESIPEEVPTHIWGAWQPDVNTTLDMPEIPSEIDWTLWDSTMQNQDHMVPPANWAGSTNTTMESWMGATSNVDYMIANGLEGFQDLLDPVNIYGPTFFAPAPPPPSGSSN